MLSDDGIGKNPVQAGFMDVQETDAEKEGIEALLSGFRPEQVPPLANDPGGSARSTRGRRAKPTQGIGDRRAPVLAKESPRDSFPRVLRGSGWLTYEADSGYRITHAGRFVDTVLSFLRARLLEWNLPSNVIASDVAELHGRTTNP